MSVPVISWTFDEVRDSDTDHQTGEPLDLLLGSIEFVPGVRGSGLKFDGFTSRLVRAAKDLPLFGPALTVEAWIAPQEYSWTGIVDHDQDGQAGFFLGINHLGQVGFYASVDGQWLGCDSQEPVALLKWSHVAGTFDPASGFTLYVNGQRVGTKVAKGNFKPAEGLDLLIGMAHRKQCPALTERDPSKTFLSTMVFDGLMDEVRIFNRALGAKELQASFLLNEPVRTAISTRAGSVPNADLSRALLETGSTKLTKKLTAKIAKKMM